MYQPTKFGVRSFIHSTVMEGIPNFKFRSRDPDHAHFSGQFVVHWLVHAMVSVCTKYVVSIFGHSKDIKGCPKFRKWSRDQSHAHLGVKLSYFDKERQAVYQPTKFGVRSFIRSKVMEGSQILNLGHVTLTTPTLLANLLCIGQYMSWSVCAPNMQFLSLVIGKI